MAWDRASNILKQTAQGLVVVGAVAFAFVTQGAFSSSDRTEGTLLSFVHFIIASIIVVFGAFRFQAIVNYTSFTLFVILFALVGLLLYVALVLACAFVVRMLSFNWPYMLANTFLCMIVTMVIADGINRHNPRHTQEVKMQLYRKEAASETAMFMWLYLDDGHKKYKMNASKWLYDASTVGETCEVSVATGWFGFEFLEE